MCWNRRVSINTFAISAFAALLALANGVVTWVQCALLLGIAAIQLTEFFMWKHVGSASAASTKANRFWSDVASVLLMSHLVFALLTLPLSLHLRLAAVAALLTAFAARTWLPPRWGGYPTNGRSRTTTVGANGHLRWDWLTPDPVRLAGYIVALLLPMYLWRRALQPVFWITFATLIVTLALYSRDGTWGSMWCWSSNAIALWLLWLVFAEAGGICPLRITRVK